MDIDRAPSNGDIDIDVDVDSYLGCFEGASRSV